MPEAGVQFVQFVSITPVILCGGSGTRLWPLSTSEHPKQFLKLDGKQTMLGHTAGRMVDDQAAGLRFAGTIVVGGARHETLISDELPAARLILEPFGRNSAAAVAAASLVADADDLLLVLPADHSILRPDIFRAAIARGSAPAMDGKIVTFGITPDFPSTGYGYIDVEPGDGPVLKAREFVEKPPLETARQYLEAGHYLWNAGIFLFRAGTMLDAFKVHAPDVLGVVRAALPGAADVQGAYRIDAAEFDSCPDISIDYAIMEKFPGVMAVPVEMGWNDVGDFMALWALSDKDADGNVLMGPVSAENCRDCYIRSEGPVIAVSGLEGMAVIAAGGQVMSCPLSDAQQVKQLKAMAEALGKTTA